MPYQPAVLNTARLNNFRLNYLTPALAFERPAYVWVILGGVNVSEHVLYESVRVRDIVFDSPNTCGLSFYGLTPTVGQPIEIWVDSDTPTLLFGGELQTVDKTYDGKHTIVKHPCTGIDDTARANRRRPLGLFTNVSATTIAQSLISTYAPGFSSAGVELGLPAITVNFDGSEAGMKGCLTQIAKLIGGYWYFENKTLYLFITPPGPAPDPIDDTLKRFLFDPPIRWTMDKSQVRTRLFGKGASTRLAATVDLSVTMIPIDTATMFNAAGGQAIAGVKPDGAASRVLTYTGVQFGGGGGLVGPGAAPSGTPGLALAPGAGIESGVHGYAMTFLTASGESLPGPIASITVGPVAPPAAPVLAAATTAGPGPSPGAHDYAVTFQTATGETTIGAVVGGNTGNTDNAATAPTPGAPTAGGAVDPGTYQYAVTFVTSIGETAIAVASAAVSVPASLANPAMGTFSNSFTNLGTGGPYPFPSNSGPWAWAYTFVTVSGETLPSPLRGASTGGGGPFYANGVLPIGPAGTIARRIYRSATGTTTPPLRLAAHIPNNTATIWEDKTADGSLGANAPAVNTTSLATVPLTAIQKGTAEVTARKLYRFTAALGWKLLDTIANNTTTTYTDTKANSALGAAGPAGNTAYLQQIKVTIPTGSSGLVTGRRIFRASPSGGAFKLAATIADNVTTAWTDTVPNASLGAAPPATNTAAANQVLINPIPLGGAGVTGRRIYRTKANQTPLLLLTQILNNTQTTGGLDLTSDASLVGAAPVSDTSGLVQPAGQVLPGATAIIVANTAAFVPSGGWAIVGNGEQAIKYSSITANSLTGIPPSGVGSLVAAVSYNSTITASPAIVGVAGILETMLQDAPIHVWVQRDDVPAQANMIALDGGGDGIYEHIISDERRSEASLMQVCDAELELYSRPLVTVVYPTRDTKTKSGKTATIAIQSPAIAESLTIQDVTITEIGSMKGVRPKYVATASSVRHSFDAILRQLIRKTEA